jgi:hypothetical protein
MAASYPTAGVAYAPAPFRPASGSSASSLVLAAIIVQFVGAGLLLLAISWFFGFSILNPYPYAWVALIGVATVAAVVVLFLGFAYYFSYRRIERGDYAGAQAPTLVLGILSILTFNVISGILYLIGYAKLGDAIREQRPLPPSPYTAPYGGAPAASFVACRACGRVFPLGWYGFCPNCGQKLGS